MRACAAGSQYKHGSFGLSHAASRPRVDSTSECASRSTCWHVRTGGNRVGYCEPNVRRDAVSAAPDVAAFDTPAVTHLECASPPLTGRLPACAAASEPHLHARLRRRWVAVQTRLLRALTRRQPAGSANHTASAHPRGGCGHVKAGGNVFVLRARAQARRVSGAPDVATLDTPVGW